MSQTGPNQSVLDNEPFYSFIKELIQSGEFNSSIAKKVTEEFDLPTTDRSIGRFRARHKLGVPTADQAYAKVEGDDAVVQSAPEQNLSYKNLANPDLMLQERGLDPQEWIIQGATVNEWEAPLAEGTKTTFHQAKLQLKRKQPECQLLPARSDGWKAPKRVPWRDPGDSYLVVITGDQQAPFQDGLLHELFCGWLEENKPAEGVLLGDTVDFPEVSKYPLDPENTATTNECIQSGYNLLREYVEASPNTKWRKLCGNHDERLRSLILGKPSTHPLYGLKQADGETPGEQAFDLKWLLRLDELGIEYIDPAGKYDLAQINLNDNLAVRHGWIARQGSGVSALATLEHLGYSVIVGHTHRQSIVYKTKHDIDGKPTTLTAAEAGCMCKVNQTPVNGRKWPSYAPVPDWVQGFSTAVVHPDTGFFRIENATFVNDTLLWRDQVYG